MCGDRCHVIDNLHWNAPRPGGGDDDANYRCNRFQVPQLLLTVEQIVGEDWGSYFSDVLLLTKEREPSWFQRRCFKLVGTSVGAGVGSLLGLVELLRYTLSQISPPQLMEYVTTEKPGKVLSCSVVCATVADPRWLRGLRGGK